MHAHEGEVYSEIRMEFTGMEVDALTALVHLEDDLLTSITGARNGEHIHPNHYSLTLRPDLTSTSPTIAYTGTMTTVYTVAPDSEGSAISFHMEDLDITALSGVVFEGDSNATLSFTNVVFDFQTTIVTLETNHTDFQPGSTIWTTVDFSAKLDPSLRSGRGLYKTPCEEGSDKYCL